MNHGKIHTLLLLVGIALSQSTAAQEESDGSPRLVNITDNV